MSETCTSPSNELWLLDTDSWLHDVRSACRGTWGLGGTEEGGVEGRWWEELWAEECGDAGQMGVNAEAGGRGLAFGADVRSVDGAAELDTGEEGVQVWAAVGEVRGLVDGRMEEERVEDDCPMDWAAEVDAKEGGRVEEEYAEHGLREGGEDLWGSWRSGDRWLGEVLSVICVSSVLLGTLLCETRQRSLLKDHPDRYRSNAGIFILYTCVPELHLHCYGVLSFTMNFNNLFLCPEKWENRVCEKYRPHIKEVEHCHWTSLI